MAILLGLGIAELAALAAAAVATVILASPAGQRATRDLANEIGRALSRDRTIDVAPPIEKCCQPCPACPACPPILPRTDIVPPSKPHWPCTGSHTHVYANEQGQDPKTCKCFCTKKEIDVICH